MAPVLFDTPRSYAVDEYTVVINGITHTVQATAEDAQSRGLEPKAVAPAANKAARKPRNKAASSDRTDDA